MVISMLNVCETLLDSVKNYFKQDKRTNAELHDKLHELFDSNNAEYKKLAIWYDGKRNFKSFKTDVIDKFEYEHNMIKKYKKSVYGDSYEIKPFEYG